MTSHFNPFTRHALAVALAGLFCTQSGSSAQTLAPVHVSPKAVQALTQASAPHMPGAKDMQLDKSERTASWPSEQVQFEHALTDLGLSLLRDLPADRNAVVSAFSLANALGLVQTGAMGKTGRELSALFQPASSGTHLLALRMGEINTALAQPQTGVSLTSANRLWVSQNLAKTLEPAYLQKTQQHYQSDAQLQNFEQPKAAADSINAWVSAKTKGKITQLLQAAYLKPDTHLVLTNAVHFKGQWATPFDRADTSNAPFTLHDGKKVNVPTMRRVLYGGWAEQNGIQWLELPYAGENVSMHIVLPAPGQSLTALQARLSGAQWSAWADRLSMTQVDVSMPRFKLGGDVMAIKASLQKLGVETVFTQAADLSAISQSHGLMLDDVYQAATVQVDEEGAQAAAATAVVAVSKGLSFPRRVEINRPFLFAIVHKPTQTQLFVGRVMNP